jgi:capsid protein
VASASIGTNGNGSRPKRGRPPVNRELRILSESIELQEKQIYLLQLEDASKQMKALAESNFIVDTDSANYTMISSGGEFVDNKQMLGGSPGARMDLQFTRRSSYFMWRTNPLAHGILRTLVKFIIGREFKLDFADTWRGKWNDPFEMKRVVRTGKNNDDQLLVRLVWEDFCKRNKFLHRAKEIVLRTLRDGECFIRRFKQMDGRINLRFVEPVRIGNMIGRTTGTTENTTWEKEHPQDGRQPTIISNGIEYLARDIETVVAYHLGPLIIAGVPMAATAERIDASDIIHTKCLADFNDLRGFPFLEPVLKALKDFEQWSEYRLILNKARTAVALVRKVDGTLLQGQALVQGRGIPRNSALGTTQTGSAVQEAAFKPGSILTPSAGVDYKFESPNLQARDAFQDGRNIQMTIAAGVGLPDMMVTADYSQTNYSSTVEAKTPAVREVEDWQDSFAPVFEAIYDWVILGAMDGMNLPKDTDRKVELHWPPIIHKDAFKETQRFERLSMNGVVSKKTWAANEGFIYDDEQENIDQEPQDLFMGLPLGVGAGPNGGQPSPKSTQNPAKPKAKAAAEALDSLADLEAVLAETTDPVVKEKLEGLLKNARLFQADRMSE